MDDLDRIWENLGNFWDSFVEKLILFSREINDWISSMSEQDKVLTLSFVTLLALYLVVRKNKENTSEFSDAGKYIFAGLVAVCGGIAFFAGAGSFSGVFGR